MIIINKVAYIPKRCIKNPVKKIVLILWILFLPGEFNIFFLCAIVNQKYVHSNAGIH